MPASYPNPQLRRWTFGPDVPVPNSLYRVMRRVFQGWMTAFWKIRVFNRHYEPASGGAVYISNHQSFLDPMLMSLALRRPMSYMARDSLFRMPGFKQIIEALNAFPVKRGKADTGALKEAMRRLKKGGQVVVFAEGTRTRDGRIGPFLPGVAMLAQRAAEWTVPVLIDGAWEAWPREKKVPGIGHIVVQYGKPLSRAEARKYSPQELVDRVRDELIEIQADVRSRIGRPALDYDA
ncbi:MAG: lysophospholipid acyltransferase family protein [Phycisphaerae bacterium]